MYEAANPCETRRNFYSFAKIKNNYFTSIKNYSRVINWMWFRRVFHVARERKVWRKTFRAEKSRKLLSQQFHIQWISHSSKSQKKNNYLYKKKISLMWESDIEKSIRYSSPDTYTNRANIAKCDHQLVYKHIWRKTEEKDFFLLIFF